MSAGYPRHGVLYRHGLTIAFLVLTLLSLIGHAWAGWHHANDERLREAQPPITLAEYMRSGEFLSSMFENWESEFLQMGMFVLLTVRLRQQGSSESRPLDPAEESPDEPVPLQEQPWPARRGGWVRTVYAHSLSLALFTLFAASFTAHWVESWRHDTEQRLRAGLPPGTLASHFTDAGFWFESLQNWQSEFLSVVALCVLSIYLREQDSPQSKAVTARHSDTGT